MAYPGYNFLQGTSGPMGYLQQLQQMRQMGGQMQPLGGQQQMQPMGGGLPSFQQNPIMGQIPAMGAQPSQMQPAPGINPMMGQHRGGGGFSPWMMLSPLAGAFASGHPNIGLGMISPGLGIARAFGAFK
jgi:hypothetical protein